MKQVIVIRKDLNMRKGKMIAQGCHAAVNVLLDLFDWRAECKRMNAAHPEVEALEKWLETGQKKIVVGVDSEEELVAIYQSACEGALPCSIITDAGHTEFDGVPTRTAVAIGPALDEEIDKITGELKPL